MDKEALQTLRNTFKMKPHLVDKPGMEMQDTFEAAWQKMKVGDLPNPVDSENVNFVDPISA